MQWHLNQTGLLSIFFFFAKEKQKRKICHFGYFGTGRWRGLGSFESLTEMLKHFTKTVTAAFTVDPLAEYKVDDQNPKCLIGRHYFFSMEGAVERATGKHVSIFSATRKNLVRDAGSEREADLVLDQVKRSLDFLIRTSHHHLLHIERSLTVSGQLVYFVTEPVTSFLGGVDVKSIPLQARKLELQHCAEAMRFLHERCNVMLLDFGPHSVYLTPSGWKIGDMMHYIPKEAIPSYRPLPAFVARLRTSPLIDYMADECLAPEPVPVSAVSAPPDLLSDLFAPDPAAPPVAPTEPPCMLPHSDVFSFLLTAVEVLRGRPLISCGGNLFARRQEMANASREVALLFPSVQSLAVTPRPSLASLAQSSALYGEDIRILQEIDNLAFGMSTVTDISFQLLKSLYNGVRDKLFCTEMLQQVVIPFALQAAKQQRMLRLVLPVFIQCVDVLPSKAVPTEVKEFFVAVIKGIVRANTFEMTGILAQQLLEKHEVVHSLFRSLEDKSTILLPFYLKCCTSPDSTLVLLSLRPLIDTLRVGVQLPSDILEQLKLLFIHSNDDCTPLVMECMGAAVPHLSDPQVRVLEASLVSGLSTSFSSPKRMSAVLQFLPTLQRNLCADHLAKCTIPLLASLLLSGNLHIRRYAAQTISECLAKFDTGLPDRDPPTAREKEAAASPYSSHSTAAEGLADLYGKPLTFATPSVYTAPPLATPTPKDNPAMSRMWGNLESQLAHDPVGESFTSLPSTGGSHESRAPALQQNSPANDLMAVFDFSS